MDHFNCIPDEIIAQVFRSLLICDKHRLTTYSNLHLVCRRWHLVCVNWAEHLPKNTDKFNINILSDGCFPNISTKYLWPKCSNFDGLDEGIKLADLLRHFDTNKNIDWLRIDAKKVITDSFLLHLINNQLTNCQSLFIYKCDTSGVSRDILTSFFNALAEGNCKVVRMYCVWLPEGVFYNPSLVPKIAQKQIDHHFSSPVQHITAQSVFRLIEAYFASNCTAEMDAELIIPERLKSELFMLRSPDAILNVGKKWRCDRFMYRTRSPNRKTHPESLLVRSELKYCHKKRKYEEILPKMCPETHDIRGGDTARLIVRIDSAA